MQHTQEFATVVVFCSLLAIGAAVRSLSRRIKIPYTLAVFLVGALCGFLRSSVALEGVLGQTLETLFAGSITPQMVIFVFLPALVFESAYAMEGHSFARNIGPIILLAVPALLVATGLTAALAVGLDSFGWGWGWSWTTALVFGALISATDPVAVVAILREAGAPKRLSTLIEGESLLNDGTAIVVFSVLVKLLLGSVALSFTGPVLQFVLVVAGGLGVGLVLSMLVTFWINRTFRNPLVEISLTLVLAYFAMIVAEGFLHVSGVMAVVVAGLWMGGPAKASVSHEATHVLHGFWEMLSYIANTLIFFLVGVLIAQQVHGAMWFDLSLVFVAWVGVMLIRVVVIFAFRPLMNRLADPISPSQALLMSWGGLRGAVSLALALAFSQIQDPAISEELRGQVLFVTAGVVMLTLLVNGSTTGWLLRRLGFDKPPLPDQLAEKTARARVLEKVEKRIDELSRLRSLQTLRWAEVEAELTRRCDELRDDVASTRAALETTCSELHAVGYWHQALGIEREAYWHAYAEGTIGAEAVKILSHEIDLQLDRVNVGDLTPPASRRASKRSLRTLIASSMHRLGLGALVGRLQMRRLALLYDLSRGEQLAAEKVLGSLDELGADDAQIRDSIAATYKGYVQKSKTRLEDLRVNLPEVVEEIETRLALRIALNLEHHALEELLEKGVMDESTGSAALEQVAWRMHELESRPSRAALPETSALCRNAPLFRDLDDDAIALIGKLTKERLLAAGDVLFEEGEQGDSMFVIARGALAVVRKRDGEEVTLGVLGSGDIVGEMALLTGEPRSATARALTPVVIGTVTREAFSQLLREQPKLKAQVWDEVARRKFDNFLREQEDYGAWDQDRRLAWYDAGRQVLLREGQSESLKEVAAIYLFLGTVAVDGAAHVAPGLVEVDHAAELRASGGPAEVVLLPDPDTVETAADIDEVV